ncbi:MAG: CbiX/SirB N-terminal domain-containing protein [Chloroflexota bacterium]|nr:hypothetical protein [Dehalococcoidia bacterium]MDW8046764.1 CbiX/SirB N-terminal domain-containing protein [Chloroflexota bacterium]
MRRGLLLVGHGSHLNPNSSAPVYQHAERIRQCRIFDSVRTAFWKEEPALARAFDGWDAEDVTVVPVFIATGYFTEQVIPRELGLCGRVSRVDGRLVRYTGAIGAHPRLADVIVERAREAGAGPETAVAVLGHGTPRNPNSERNIYLQAERVARRGLFRDVVTVFLDQEPNMRDVLRFTNAATVVIVPLFVADGWHVDETIPEELELEGPDTVRDGRRIRYAGAVGTHPSLAEVILHAAEEAAGWA